MPDSGPGGQSRRQIRVGIAVAAVFWLMLALAGFPRAYPDDAIMIGPALGLRDHGFLDNVFLSRAFYPEPAYLFYPPTFSWALLGWISLFGQSLKALALFWAACCIAASIALGTLISRLGRISWGIPAACVLLLGCVAYSGIRMEILGFATFFWGVMLTSNGRAHWRGPGYFLLFVTPTIAPTFLAFCLVASLALFVRRISARELVLAGGGLALACLVLILACQGDVGGLARTMYKYSSIRVGIGGRGDFLQNLVRVLGLGVIMTAAICLVRIKALGEKVMSAHVMVPVLLTTGFALSVATHSRPSIWIAYTLGQLFLLALTGQALLKHAQAIGAGWASLARLATWPVMPIGLLVFLAAFNGHYAARYAPVPLSPGLTAIARTAVEGAPAADMVFADAAVFGALDFPTARPMRDAMVVNPWPDYLQDFKAIPKGQTWVLSLSNFLALSQNGGGRVAQTPRLARYLVAPGGARVDAEQVCVLRADASVVIAQDIDAAVRRYCRAG
ncbi:MAG: hypothetical protein ABL914_08240 [Novosphingobium sp.]|uniref:hypothetical protein n=1 Tax=Novosphingobium sp. TaxID=1874826 RepID=UPI0032B9B315